MKQTFILLFALFNVLILSAQNQALTAKSKLISGCPDQISMIKKQLGLKDVTHAFLETGIDSIDIVFGTFTQGDRQGYWISHYFNKKAQSFKTIALTKNEATGILSNDVDIDFDNSSKRISLKVEHLTLSNEIAYKWLDSGKQSKILTINTIDRLLQQNKAFPNMKLETLDGKVISTHDLHGKYLVINWWATTCSPCRAEIPGLNKLVEKYKGNDDIVFLAVAFDKKARLEYYLKFNDYNYKQTLGNKEVAQVFGESFPKNLIVNPNGVITYYSEGGNEHQYMKIDKALQKELNN